MSYNFRVVSLTYCCLTQVGVTSMTGSLCQRYSFVSFWLQWIEFRTLSSTSCLSWTRVLALHSPLEMLASGFGSIKPFSTKRGHSNQAITTPSHCTGISWSLATTRQEGWGLSPGHHSNTSSSARCRIWCPRSMDALYAYRVSSPKMNSFVILVMNTHTHIFNDRHPLGHCHIVK
jgi:hypothetical protein